MKKIMIILTALFTMAIQTNAMTYDQAREHALFLTDKMAYELNLTDDQYEAAYEINLDYLMSIGTYDDLYGRYWTQRNLDLSYILYDWQYQLYVAASYFYRPLTWSNGFWRFVIYSHYPHRNFLYFGRPNFYSVYRGGHSWRTNNGRSWYQGRTWGGPNTNGQKRIGMRDNYDKGNFKSGNSNNRNNVNRQDNRTSGTNRNNSSQFGSRNSNRTTNNGNVKSGNSTYRNSSPNRNNSTQFKNNSSRTTNSNRSSSTVGNRTNINKSTSGSNFGGRSSSTRTTVNQNRSTNINRSSQSSSIGSKPSSTFSKGSSSSRSTSGSRSSSSSHSSGSKSSGSKGGGSFGGGRK